MVASDCGQRGEGQNAEAMNMSAAFYTRRRQCFTVAAEKFDTCGGGI